MNLYEKVLVIDVNMLDKNKSQMEQWSILSDNIVYVRSVGYEQMSGVDIKMVDYQDHRKIYKKMGKEEGQMINIDFVESPEVLKAKYMDVYEDVFAEVVTTNRFDENVDLSTTYLGKMIMKREDIMEVEEGFSNLRTRFCYRKSVGWRGMSDSIGYRCEQILYVKILLFDV